MRASAWIAALALAAAMLPAAAGTLVIESWRVDDQALWENVLLPAFARNHPEVTVKFGPTAPLSHHLIAVRNPVAKQMAEWRKRCASTIRVNAQVLNRGQPGMEVDLWAVTSQVLNGSLAPRDGAARLQAGFAKWVKVGQNATRQQ